MTDALYSALVLRMSDLTVDDHLVLPQGSSRYRAEFLIDHIWPRILASLPGGQTYIKPACERCGEHVIAGAEWEGRFFLLLAAHERALRMLEEAGRD